MALNNTSNLPTVQRLKYEDYANNTDWKKAFEHLINTLNLFITPIYNIVNMGIGYTNLVAPQLVFRTITAAATTTFNFVNPLSIAPSAVMVGNVYSTSTSTHPVAVVQVMWHYSGNTIYVDNVIGLVAGTAYTMTLVVL